MTAVKQNLNIVIAMCMLHTFGEDLVTDVNEQQSLVTLTNPRQDCYCTVTEDEYKAMLTTFGMAYGNEELADEVPEDDGMTEATLPDSYEIEDQEPRSITI